MRKGEAAGARYHAIAWSIFPPACAHTVLVITIGKEFDYVSEWVGVEGCGKAFGRVED